MAGGISVWPGLGLPSAPQPERPSHGVREWRWQRFRHCLAYFLTLVEVGTSCKLYARTVFRKTVAWVESLKVTW